MAYGLLEYRGSDEVERYMGAHWALPLHSKVAEQTPDQFVEFDSDTREDIESRLPSAHNLFYFGHGFPSALGNPPLIDASNVGQVDGMVVAIACHSAETLGPVAVNAGTRSYVGFIRRLPIVRAPAYDALIVDSLIPLATGQDSTGAFRERFQAACFQAEQTYLSGRVRNPNAHLIGSNAALMGERLRVLGDDDSRC
jgi:hypothetical protein